MEEESSPKRRLIDALQIAGHAIYRGPIGCFFVMDVTAVGNGYIVTFNGNPDTPLAYTAPTFDSCSEKVYRYPFILSSREKKSWYRNFEDLLVALKDCGDELAWEGIHALEVQA